MRVKKLVLTLFSIAVIGMVVSFTNPPQASGTEGCEATYKAKCAACHAVDGSGNTVTGKKLNVRDLRSPDVQKLSDAKLLELITAGKGKMPGYEKTLGKEKCTDLVAYMRELAKK
jgi:mono/diheme cytochrome c family protein